MPPGPNVQLGKEKKKNVLVVCVCVCVWVSAAARQYWVWSVSYSRHARNYADFSAPFTQWPAAPHFPFSLSLTAYLSSLSDSYSHTTHSTGWTVKKCSMCVCVDGVEKEREREWKRNQGTVCQKLMLFRSGKNCVWLWRESRPADLMRTHWVKLQGKRETEQECKIDF